MNRQFVQSSDLQSIGYDPNTNVLEIEFKSGGIYQYFNVPESKYEGLMKADSHGKYFDAYIKKGGYRFKKIR
ncbi:MAG: KTSC domain-containing protein [Euryarchaeota archaeon]|nr:KTSC domain-containing protein [Euryarchaeota archaeon]